MLMQGLGINFAIRMRSVSRRLFVSEGRQFLAGARFKPSPAMLGA